jgi:23S rRNA pseudouridine2605 synthase
MIAGGRVRINGERAILGRRVDPAKDVVEVDGSAVPLRATLRYLLLNKPIGVVSSALDPEGRPTVLDYVDVAERVWPVGRLDVDTEGALLITNDGELTFRLTHPSYEVPKRYLVEAKGLLKGADIRRLRAGIELEDGPTAPAEVVVIDQLAKSTLVEVQIHEGRNRQVRRMFEAAGHPVTRLARIAVGPVRLGRLKPGTARRLTLEEVRALYRAVGL